MAQTVQDVMTRNPRQVRLDDPIVAVARVMRDENIGDVIVTDGGQVCGISTDRDIVVRAIAEGKDAHTTKVDEIYSGDVTTISPDASLEEAARLMREKAIRRLPVVENGRAVGIVSLGDLSTEHDVDATLAGISSAPPNN